MKKILVPTDFSEQANNALDLAHDLASTSKAELIILNVLDIPGGHAFAPGGASFNVMGGPAMSGDLDNVYVVELHNKTKEKLESIIREPKYKDINISYKLQLGNPYHNISEEIVDNQVDLVVMGTKGTSGMEEMLIGSNTEKVVRLAKCPVLTVKKKVDTKSIKKILFASSFTEQEDHVIEELKKLQNLLSADLHLLKVNTPNNFQTSRQIKKEIEDYISKYDLNHASVNICNEVVEEDGIIYFSEEINTDLIAMATHGRTGFMHLLSGSIAEDVVNHAQRPVWTCTLKHK
ncbi:MAG: universal stress protein [Cyclobacteriaceae bacterium]